MISSINLVNPQVQALGGREENEISKCAVEKLKLTNLQRGKKSNNQKKLLG